MHHLSLTAMLFFIVGDALHALAQVDAVARAKKLTRTAVLQDRWVSLVIRGAICTAIFVLWLQGQIADVARGVNVPIPTGLNNLLDLHISGAIATLAGYACDSVLGYVPFLQKLGVPPAVDATNSQGAPPAPPTVQ